jgi:chitin disaccharide deacetylase
VVASQIDEYRRVYRCDSLRMDGHHHMHLCANVLLARLLPAGAIVRRNFTFLPGEKGIFNRMYRRMVDSRLRKRHQICDYLFNLVPLQPSDRLRRIFSLAQHSIVEVETHPVNADEYRFLMDGEASRLVDDVQVARHFAPCSSHATPSLNAGNA